VPSLLVLYLAALAVVRDGRVFLPLVMYCLLAVIFSIREGIRRRMVRSALLVPMLFPLFHCAYGVGMIRGFLLYPLRKKNLRNNEVKVRRVKTVGDRFEECV
jgi:hypothetical protein